MAKVAAKFQPIKSHVAVLPSPGMGNFTPLFEFAKHLAIHHSFHVTLFYITTNASAAQNHLVHSPNNLPPNLHIIDLPPVDLSTIVNDKTPLLTHLCLNIRESLRCLNTLLTQLPNKPQALIIDMFCTQAFDACNDNNVTLSNIPIFTFFTASTRLLAFSLFLPQLDRDVEGEFVNLPEPVQVPGCKPIRTQDLLDQVTNRNTDEYKWYLYHMSRVPMSAGILLNTWKDLEPVTLTALKEHSFYHNIPTPPVYPIGPLIKENEPVTKTGSECLAWLDKQPSGSVLYVSFGSGGVLSVEQQTELAWGLELSGQRFLWVVHAPTGGSASAAFFNPGGDGDDLKSYLPEGFIERTRGRGLAVVSWAPQVAILSHPSTGAFLSHCGWNSTLESVAHGVPMIAWPLYAEQRMNAAMLEEDVGVAVRVVGEEGGSGVIERKEIEMVVRMMMMGGDEGKALKRRATELSESASKMLQIGDSSFETRAALVNQWKAQLKT